MDMLMLSKLSEVVNEKTFWQDPLGWISRGVTQGIADFFANALSNAVEGVLTFLEATSDTFTLFAITILILAQMLGVDRAKNYRGIVIVAWIVTQAILAFRHQ